MSPGTYVGKLDLFKRGGLDANLSTRNRGAVLGHNGRPYTQSCALVHVLLFAVVTMGDIEFKIAILGAESSNLSACNSPQLSSGLSFRRRGRLCRSESDTI